MKTMKCIGTSLPGPSLPGLSKGFTLLSPPDTASRTFRSILIPFDQLTWPAQPLILYSLDHVNVAVYLIQFFVSWAVVPDIAYAQGNINFMQNRTLGNPLRQLIKCY